MSKEDYMSDEFLILDKAAPPSGPFDPHKRIERELYVEQLEWLTKKAKILEFVRERKRRDEGLATAIPTDNKGFKMLLKMGFKQGDTLGTSKKGLREPVNIVLRRKRIGFGKETHDLEVVAKKISDFKNRENEYRQIKSGNYHEVLLRRDFFKAQRLCEELDFRENVHDPVEDFYWTKRKLVDKTGHSQFYCAGNFLATEENLTAIVDYLRERHFYCFYCGLSGEDLQENCPGPYRIHHLE